MLCKSDKPSIIIKSTVARGFAPRGGAPQKKTEHLNKPQNKQLWPSGQNSDRTDLVLLLLVLLVVATRHH